MTEYVVERVHGIHAVHDGSRHAPPLLLIHGSGASGAFWGPMAPALAARHYVIRVDLPGCGQSPPAASYDVPAQAGRVAALLDHLGLRRVAVAGHSSGGYVATALAERRPDLVGSITLISSGPSVDAFLPEPLILRVLLAPPIGPLLWPLRSDAMLRRGIQATAARAVDVPDDVIAAMRGVKYRALRTMRRASPPRAVTSTSPTFTARPGRSPGSRPRPWPPRRGSRSTTSRGRRRHRFSACRVERPPPSPAPAPIGPRPPASSAVDRECR